METIEGDLAVEILVDRVRELPLDTLIAELRGGVQLIESFYPEVRSLDVARAIADALT